MVQLHSSFSTVFIPALEYAKICALLSDPLTTTTNIVRKIMYALIAVEIWSSNGMNANTIKANHLNKYGSCIGI